ncbi:MAG: hypothetical protein ABH850_04710 [Candidatus Micrarchaeota archaeon]
MSDWFFALGDVLNVVFWILFILAAILLVLFPIAAIVYAIRLYLRKRPEETELEEKMKEHNSKNN